MKSPAPDSLPPPVRVGYVLKMFPRLSETFILNEVLELEQQGLALHIFSLKRPVDTVRHEQTQAVRSRITYLPEKISQAPWRVLQAQCHVALRHRRAWRHALRHTLRQVRASRDDAALRGLVQACCLVREMRGIRHLHAHYANVPAKIALLVHRLSGASYSITTHAKDIFQQDPFASPKLHERLSRATFIVANSSFSAQHIRTGLGGQGEIHVIYNGLDLASFPRRTTEPAEPLILSVGRLVEKKGFSALIAVCQLLKQRGVRFTCELVGTGPLSQVLKDQIRTCGVGDRVRLLGPLPQQVLRQHYERAMVFALPCVEAADGDRDILPNVIKEAMAVGVPVATTRLDGIEELIDDGVSGALVAPGDVPSFAEKLVTLLGDATLRQGLAEQGRRAVETRFDRRTNFAQLKTLLLGAVRSSLTQRAGLPEARISSYDANCLREQ